MSAAQATTAVDDERVRVTTWTFGADGGSPYLGTAGTEHDVVNAGGAPAVFVEIELKR